MIPDTTLETVLNLWKEGKINLGDVRKLLHMEQPIQWKQTEPLTAQPYNPWTNPFPMEPLIPWIQPVINPWLGDSIAWGTWVTTSTNDDNLTTHVLDPKIPLTYT